jgi:hypothetical protein
MTSTSESTKKTENSSSPDVEMGTFSETIDMVPGTRLLLNPGRDDGSTHIVLSPEPSSDPDDPLNWSITRKTLSFLVVNVYSFMVAVVALSTAVTYGALIAEFGTTAEYLNLGTAVSILFIGMGNIIWNPMVSYSRHPRARKKGLSNMSGPSIWSSAGLHTILSLDRRRPGHCSHCTVKRRLCGLSYPDGVCCRSF